MQTISVISNISFNTPEFFRLTIERLTSPAVSLLDWCHWIEHQPDTDQRKPHIHFVCKPSKRIDTNALRREFLEPVSEAYIRSLKEVTENDLKPLGVLPFEKTRSMSDWLLYAVHDEKYLFKKGQRRNTTYPRQAVKSTDPDFLAAQWEDTVDPLDALTGRVVEMVTVDGLSFSEVLQTGIVPPNLVIFYDKLVKGLPRGLGVVRKGEWNEDPSTT